MPAAVPALVGLAATAGATALGIGTFGAALIGGFVAAGVGALIQEKPKLGSLDGLDAGILANIQSPVQPIPVIYGTRRVGGTRVFVKAQGTNNDFLHMVIVWGEGEISAINETYLDEVPISSGKFGSGVEVYHHTGSDSQLADATLVSRVTEWTADHKLSGLAYTYLRLQFSSEKFQAGVPVVTVDVDGKLVFDPRDSTTKFSRNPALCIRDYLTNTRYGRGIPTSDIDDSSFIAAANHCDELVSVPDGAGGTTTQARYTCDGVVDTDQKAIDNLDSLLSSCRGMLVFSGGKYRLVIDKAETPSVTIDESMLVGPVAAELDSVINRWNRVRVEFFNPDADWKRDTRTVDSASFRTADNGRLLESIIRLPFTANQYTAQQIAGIELRQSRFQIVVTCTLTIEGLRFEVGDVVMLTHEAYGWQQQKFRVIALELTALDEVRAKLLEYDDSVYNLDSLNENVPPTPPALPDVFDPEPVTGLAVASELVTLPDGTSLVNATVTWAASVASFVASQTVQWKKTAASNWNSATLSPDVVEHIVTGLEVGTSYDFRVRVTNSEGYSSAWAMVTSTLSGDTTPPGVPTSPAIGQTANAVEITWTNPPDDDLAFVETWRSATNDSATASLVNAQVGSRNIDFPGPGSVWYYWLRAVDKSGNASALVPGATAGLVGQQPSGELYVADWNFTNQNAWLPSTGEAGDNAPTYSQQNLFGNPQQGIWTWERTGPTSADNTSRFLRAAERTGPFEWDATQDPSTPLTVAVEMIWRHNITAGTDATVRLFAEWRTADGVTRTDSTTFGGGYDPVIDTTASGTALEWITSRAAIDILPLATDPLGATTPFPHYIRFWLAVDMGDTTTRGTVDVARLRLTVPVN